MEVFKKYKEHYNLIKCNKGVYLVGRYQRKNLLNQRISNIMIIQFLDENGNHISNPSRNQHKIKDVLFKEFAIKENNIGMDKFCRIFKLSNNSETEINEFLTEWSYFYPKYQQNIIDSIKKILNSKIDVFINILLK